MNSWLELETPTTIRGDVEESKQMLRDILHRLELIGRTEECFARGEQALAALERLAWTLERRFGQTEGAPPQISAVLDLQAPRTSKPNLIQRDLPRLFVAARHAELARR